MSQASTHKELTLEYEQFLISFKQNVNSTFAFLLGAGASKSSGVPTADECIWEWKYLLYEAANKTTTPLPSPKVSPNSKTIIQEWLNRQQDTPELGSTDEYSYFAERAFPIDSDRRRYFENLFTGKSPSIGYRIIALLNKYGIVRSVWSTNFDGLTERAAQMHCVTPIVITPDNVDRIYRTDNTNELLCVSLHGDYKYTSLKNTTKELENQNEVLVEMLKHQLASQHLVVMGYSGRDKSLMDALNAAYSAKGAGSLYWCGYGDTIPEPVIELIQNCRNNGRAAYYIPTNGFDDTLYRLFTFSFVQDQTRMDELEKLIRKTDYKTASCRPFSINVSRRDGYLRSNLHPITIPKWVYQFSYKIDPECNPWKIVREIAKKAGQLQKPVFD